MNRQQKEHVVESLRKSFTQSNASFLVSYNGLSVAQLQSLRKNLRSHGGVMHVAKARLMRRAADGIHGAHDMSLLFKNQVALIFAGQEPIEVAKLLHSFSKECDKLSLVAGVFEEQLLNVDGVIRMASLPPREVLLSQLLGVLQAPTRKLVIVLNMQILRLLWTLNKIAEKK